MSSSEKIKGNGFHEEDKERSYMPGDKVDPGKPASVNWQRKLNSIGNAPTQFTLSLQETLLMIRKHWEELKRGISALAIIPFNL